jgi:uncharacterized protein (DUF427 family)
MKKTALQPGPDHPIDIEPLGRSVTVTVAGKPVATSSRALLLKEASYPGVIYIPREDANMALLQRSDHTTHCPYKGDASYYSIPSGGARAKDAVWTYEDPHEAVSVIKDYLAFYPDRVDAISS